MKSVVEATNATKGLITTFVNTALALAVSFGAELSTEQIGAIIACVNAAIALFIGLTYKRSHKRVPDID